MNRAWFLAALALIALIVPARAQAQTVALRDDALVTVSDNVTV